jgi:adenine-specific DNA-methyltransferase
VKANHVEKTDHPCQFPIALAQRVIKATTSPGDLILDPYMGSCTTGAAAVLLGRTFVGAELNAKYYRISVERMKSALANELRFRPEDKPIYEPPPNTPLTTIPSEWRQHERISMPAIKTG